MWNSNTSSLQYLHLYQKCLLKRKRMREAMALPQDKDTDRKFCAGYYKLYKQKMYTEIVSHFV